MRLLTLVAVASLVAACGSPAPDGPSRSRNSVVVAVDGDPGTVAAANWRRFEDNVRIWAPDFALEMRTGPEAGEPAGRVADVRAGTVQVASLPPAAAAALVPELGVLSVPGLFASREEADFVLDGVALESYRQLFSAKGLRLLDWIDDDWRDPNARTYEAGVIVAGKDWYERLTPHDRDVFAQAYGSAGQARADSRAASRPATGAGGDDTGQVADPAAAILQAGGQSQQVYDLILQGKQEFAARSAVASDPAAATR